MEQKFKPGDLVRFRVDTANSKPPLMIAVKYSLKDPFSNIDFKTSTDSPYVICRWYSTTGEYKTEIFHQSELDLIGKSN